MQAPMTNTKCFSIILSITAFLILVLSSNGKIFLTTGVDQAVSDSVARQVPSPAWKSDTFPGLSLAEDLSLFGLPMTKENSTRWAGGVAAFAHPLGHGPNFANHGDPGLSKYIATSATPKLIGPLPTG